MESANKLGALKQHVLETAESGIDVGGYADRLAALTEEVHQTQRKIAAIAKPQKVERLASKSTLCNKLMIGFGIAMVFFIGVSTYLTYRDMVNKYNVTYTAIPRYIVDEKDLVTYNSKGEKIILKNIPQMLRI